MRKRVVRVLAVVVTGQLVALAGPAVPASAQAPQRETFHEAYHGEEEDFCDSGLSVAHDGVVSGRFMVNKRGENRLWYYMENVRFEEVLTSENGDTARNTGTVTDKDLRVTDNGDGTLTVLVLATGNATTFDGDGKAIARNPGQVRFEVLLDHGGTPSDPSDDQFIEFLGLVKESTGRTDDYCAAVLSAWS